MNIKLVIFDWSGVISDDRKPVYEVYKRIMEEYNKPVMLFENFISRVPMTAAEDFMNHGIHGSPDELLDLFKKYFDEVIKSGIAPKIYPDAHDVLRYLKGKGKLLAILSSHHSDNLRDEAERYDVVALLDMIVGSSNDKVKGLQDICQHLGVNPKSSIYVGDTIHDIRSAKQAGINSAGICTGYHTREMLMKEEPDLFLENLSELKNKIL